MSIFECGKPNFLHDDYHLLAGIDDPRRRRVLREGVADVILKQIGGAGRLRAMIGVKHFLTLKNGLAFKWPSRQRSRGNYVEIVLTPADEYDMEFFTVDKWGDKQSRKKYAGLMFDQLIPTFERQTGLALRL